MARINNKTIYPIKSSPKNKDTVLGTDSENDGKTVQFELETLLNPSIGVDFLPKGGYTGTAQTIVDSIPEAITNTSQLVNDGDTRGSTYVENDELAPVAISGSYNDLTDKPISIGGGDNFSRVITVYLEDIPQVSESIEEDLCIYINSLNYNKLDTDSEVWIELLEVKPT